MGEMSFSYSIIRQSLILNISDNIESLIIYVVRYGKLLSNLIKCYYDFIVLELTQSHKGNSTIEFELKIICLQSQRF